MTRRRKPPRALRRLFPLIPQGEMAREAVETGLANELAADTFPGLDGPVIRRFEEEARQLGGDPLLDALEEPDYEDDYDPRDHEEP